MKSLFATLVVVLILSSLPSAGAVSVSSQPDSFTFDRYANLCWEDEKARLDNFAIQLQNTPSVTGYIFVFAGKISCQGEAKFRADRAKKWVEKRGVKSNRIVVKDAGYRKEVQTELWLVPSDVPPPTTESEFKKSDVSTRRCVDKLFARVICLDRQ